MARYIDADKFIERIKVSPAFHNVGCDGYFLRYVVLDLLNNIPTADVVPKSEIREIFEEIERFLYMHFRFCKEEIGNDDTEYVKGRLELNTQIQNFIAELKKKYTEGEE